MKKRQHWTTKELCKEFGEKDKPLSRSRISKLASSRGVKSLGRIGRYSEAIWPADAHITLKPDVAHRRKQA